VDLKGKGRGAGQVCPEIWGETLQNGKNLDIRAAPAVYTGRRGNQNNKGEIDLMGCRLII